MSAKSTDLEAYSALIGTIYNAGTHPHLWSRVLEQMCDALDAKAASVHVVNPILGRASLFCEHGTDPAFTALLLDQYAKMSPIGSAFLVAELDQPIGAFDFIDEEEFVESRFYKEWCLPQGYHDMLGAIIAKRPDEVGAVSATRTLQRGRFGEAERHYLGLIAPHVRRAVAISGLLEQHELERDTFARVMDGLAAAVVLMDRSGRAVRLNSAAADMCSSGEVMTVIDGRLAIADPHAARAIREAASGSLEVPQLISINGPNGQIFIAGVVLVEPVAGISALIVNRQTPEMPAVGRALSDAFHLSPRELSVLMPMLAGKTIEDIAAELGIGLSTAKTHLNKIFRKTGTNRQADLVQKVVRLMPPIKI